MTSRPQNGKNGDLNFTPPVKSGQFLPNGVCHRDLRSKLKKMQIAFPVKPLLPELLKKRKRNMEGEAGGSGTNIGDAQSGTSSTRATAGTSSTPSRPPKRTKSEMVHVCTVHLQEWNRDGTKSVRHHNGKTEFR